MSKNGKNQPEVKKVTLDNFLVSGPHKRIITVIAEWVYQKALVDGMNAYREKIIADNNLIPEQETLKKQGVELRERKTKLITAALLQYENQVKMLFGDGGKKLN